MANSEIKNFLEPTEKKELLPKPKPKFWGRKRFFGFLLLTIFLSSIFGFLAGIVSGNYFYSQIKNYLQKLGIGLPQSKVSEKENNTYIPQSSQEAEIINVVKQFSPAVVSIVITKDVPKYVSPFEGFPFFELQVPGEMEKKEVGGGTGFIISPDGMILTNKHVVLDKEAEYTVLTNDGKKFPAKALARDPTQDLAIIKIEGNDFPVVQLGNSDNLQIGQTVITIGNVLGEFRNSVSVGVISGLGRTISASGGSFYETLEDVIQTDAAINPGNSGGPLLNLKGEVIGMNTAMASGAENIGFALPINKTKKAIEQIKTLGKIVYPFLGVRYVLITDEIQKENNLSVNYGAWVKKGDQGEAAVTLGSAADKAGIREGDIILEFNGDKITTDNSLAKIIQKYNPGDKATLKILRGTQEKIVEVILDERNE
jgi:S1-C subfamily serine protease